MYCRPAQNRATISAGFFAASRLAFARAWNCSSVQLAFATPITGTVSNPRCCRSARAGKIFL